MDKQNTVYPDNEILFTIRLYNIMTEILFSHKRNEVLIHVTT